MIEELMRRAAEIERLESAWHLDAERLLRGKKARIIDQKYNGQPYGRSRKPLAGKVLTIAWALRWGDTIGVGFVEENEGIKISGVEIL